MSRNEVYLSLKKDTHFIYEKRLGKGTSSIVVRAHLDTKAALQSKSNQDSKLGGDSIDKVPEEEVPVVNPVTEPCAIKIFTRETSSNYWRERRSLEKLRANKYVINMHKAVTSLDKCYIIMEECTGDLYELALKVKRLTEGEAKFLFKQMIMALTTVHSKGICHHDVKLDNFLIGKDGNIKLADFGFSVSMNESDLTYRENGQMTITGDYTASSPAYSSPQVLHRLPHAPVATDIFGLGVCLYRLLCGNFPFCHPQKDSLDTLRKNLVASKESQSVIKFPSYVSDSARKLVCGMLAYEESERFGWETIINSEWCSQHATRAFDSNQH